MKVTTALQEFSRRIEFEDVRIDSDVYHVYCTRAKCVSDISNESSIHFCSTNMDPELELYLSENVLVRPFFKATG